MSSSNMASDSNEGVNTRLAIMEAVQNETHTEESLRARIVELDPTAEPFQIDATVQMWEVIGNKA